MKRKTFILAFLTTCMASSVIAGDMPLSQKEKTFLSEDLFTSKHRRSSSDKVIGIGAQISLLRPIGIPSLIGFGVNGIFSPSGEKNAYFAEFNYYLPSKQTNTETAYALSSATNPERINVDVTTKLSALQFRVGFRRYMIKDVSEDGFKLYLNVHAGALIFRGVNTTSDYNSSLYSISSDPTFNAFGFIIGGGLGAEYSIQEKMNIFVEGNINIPANNVNGEEVEVEIPVTLQPTIGFRYHF
jgi:hypothetical protein